MRKQVTCVGLCLILTLALGAKAAPLDDPEYYDPALPKEPRDIRVKPFAGERYQAEVPDTLDLAHHADEALNCLTRMISPAETDYCIYHLAWGQFNPTIFEIGHGSNQNQNAKWAESVVLMRAMTGSQWNTEGDQKLMGSLVRYTGKDGLFYVPVKNRPWAYIDPVMQKAGKPHADTFAEGRQLRTFATWYQHDHNPLWKQIADRKVRRLRELAVKKDDTLYFKLARGYSPWYRETGKGPVVALGDVGQVFPSMTGDGAANMVCWMPQAGATWYRVTGNRDALELAGGLARYLYRDPEFFDRRTSRFGNYSTFFTHCMNSLLSYALVAGDREMVSWVKKGCDQFFEHHDPDRTGVTSHNLHACDFGDMLQVACMLSRTGHGDYWEDIDRWIRNGLPHRQLTQEQVEQRNKMPVTRLGDPKTTATLPSLAFWVKGDLPLNRKWPHLHQPDDANERCRGACGGAGCCQGNLTRGLYLVWDSILESQDGRLRVNLLLNRASPWADVSSWVPYQGKAVIRMKRPHREVLVRIPQWTDRKQVACAVNGRQVKFTWAERGYARLGEVKAGDEVRVEFPMKEREVQSVLKVGTGQRVGTLKLNYISLSEVADSFKGRAAGKLDEPGKGNNKGATGLVWGWNTGVGQPPTFDGKSSLEIPIAGNWNQYIDTVTMPPFVLGGKAATFVAVFQKTAKGDVALGFVRDLTWDTGKDPKGQRLFKIKGNKVYFGSRYDSGKTDIDTGARIVPDRLQGLMMKKDAKGNVTYFYQDGGDRDPASRAWRDITPASGRAVFPLDLGHIGVNSLREDDTEKVTVTLRGNTIVAISNNFMGYPVDRHQKFRKGAVGLKKVQRFVTGERFVWW
jgi:hypothetical protein